MGAKKKLTQLLLSVLASLIAMPVVASGPDGTEWQDLSRMSSGREKMRAAFSPFSDAESALAILPWESDRMICLDSSTEWRFRWSKDPDSRPKGFEAPTYDVSQWEKIRVPSSWQAFGANGRGGWGFAIHTNSSFPFKMDPPFVMGDPPKHYTTYTMRNPVGSYRRDFDIPDSWRGERFFLKLDGVESFFYLWVNGQYVGFSKDSRSTSEFDITDYARPGNNTLALEVYSFSDGSYLEDQDMFTLGGVFRSVWLLRRPQTRIRDFFARSQPLKDRDFGGVWELSVESEIAGEGDADVEVRLYDMDGNAVPITRTLVAPSSDGVGQVQYFTVQSPRLWSPEIPNCYKLILSIPGESVSSIFGFRTSEIRNGRYELNGVKVKFQGVNRSETDPMYGHHCPRERMEQDIALLKQANCKIVRNSHCPQEDYWYYLCDINGIALMDEANVEMHGLVRYKNYASRHSPGDDPRWKYAAIWRNLNMVERNKNHPSVLFWSLGNECMSGCVMRAANDAVHARDHSRPTHYQQDWDASDMNAKMYPPLDVAKQFAVDTLATRPFFINEYAHANGNTMALLREYRDLIESSDVIIGGCVWDWCNQGLYKNNGSGKRIVAYGGDWGETPNDGISVLDGVISSDRLPEPDYWEMKHVFQPVLVEANADGKSVTLRNRQFFLDLGTFDLTETVLVNGCSVSRTTLDLTGVPPRGEKILPLPALALAANKPGSFVSVRYEFVMKQSDGVLAEGYVVASDQIDLPNESGLKLLPVGSVGNVSVRDSRGYRTVQAGNLNLSFDLESGALVSYRHKNVERLQAPMALDVFRAPSGRKSDVEAKCLEMGWRHFVQKATRFGKVEKSADGSVMFCVDMECRGYQPEKLCDWRTVKTHLEKIGEGTPSQAASWFSAQIQWCIRPDGIVTCRSMIRPKGEKAEIPRIGWHFTLPKNVARMEWFGRGPFGNYRNKMTAAFIGLWEMDLLAFRMPFERPNDCNSFEETNAVAFCGTGTDAVSFVTLGEPFSFSALPWTPGEIINATHSAELSDPAKVEFGIYARTCGLSEGNVFTVPWQESYVLDFAIIPRLFSFDN